MLELLLKPWVATCTETRARLSDYVDDELDGRRLLRVRRHLGRCERCRAMLESLTRTLDALRSLGSLDQPASVPGIEAAVLARIREPER